MDSCFSTLQTNPFGQLIDPASVVAVHERLGARANIARQVHRPLDRTRPNANRDQAAFDAAVEAADLRRAEAQRRSIEAAARRHTPAFNADQ